MPGRHLTCDVIMHVDKRDCAAILGADASLLLRVRGRLVVVSPDWGFHFACFKGYLQ